MLSSVSKCAPSPSLSSSSSAEFKGSSPWVGGGREKREGGRRKGGWEGGGKQGGREGGGKMKRGAEVGHEGKDNHK